MKESVSFCDYNINLNLRLPLSDFDYPLIINTINPHSFIVAQKDLVFKAALCNSDYLFPDGIGVVWALKYFYKDPISRISGFEIHKHLLDYCKINDLKRICYFGSSEKVLDLVEKKLSLEYDSYFQIKKISPAFKESFCDNENSFYIRQINNFCPDVVFVGMTAPKQEKWTYLNKNKINSKFLVSIGAVFDFYAETEKRAPKLMIMLGFEWLYRFVQNPKRMYPRIINGLKFFFLTLRLRLF